MCLELPRHPKSSMRYLTRVRTSICLSFDAAMKLFRDLRLSKLRVIGISGKTLAADVSGQLVLDLSDAHGCRYRVDFGTAHGMRGCPMNILSVSLLVEIGATLHFEKETASLCHRDPQKRFRCEPKMVCIMFRFGVLLGRPGAQHLRSAPRVRLRLHRRVHPHHTYLVPLMATRS